MVEKYQSYLQNAIRIYSRQTGLPYQDLIVLIQKGLNGRILSVRPYKFTPELLMFGNSLPDNEALLQVEEPSEQTSPEEFCGKMLEDLASLRKEYLSKRKKFNDQKRDIVNRKRVHKVTLYTLEISLLLRHREVRSSLSSLVLS